MTLSHDKNKAQYTLYTTRKKKGEEGEGKGGKQAEKWEKDPISEENLTFETMF